MGKSKKDRRNRQDSDPEDELVTQTAAVSIKDGEGKNEKGENAPPKQKKKDKKKKGRKEESDDDDEEDGIAALAQKVGLTESKNKPKQAAGFSAFQMLQDDDEMASNSESEEEEEEAKPAPKPTKKESEKNGENEDDMETSIAPAQKNKKKKGKKGKPAEEDIDAILAEIEKPAEKQDKKKKKGKKEDKGEEQNEEEEEEKSEEVTPQPAVEGDKADKKGGPKLIDFSAMTQDEIAAMFDDEDEEEEDRKKKKKKKKGKKGAAAEEEKEGEEEGKEEKEEGEDQEDGTVKTAAQKKKEKKERQRLQKLQLKKKGGQQQKKEEEGEEEGEEKKEVKDEKDEKDEKESAKDTEAVQLKKQPSEERTKAPSEEKEGEEEGADGDEKGSDDEGEGDKKKRKKDRKKKKDKDDKEKKEEPKKKPGNKQLKLIQEMQQKVKDEEDRMIREEEEKERRFEEARKQKEEEDKKKSEKKEREKQKKKEKIERQKAEGKYLTPKQKEAQKRAQQMVEMMQAQGLHIPVPGQADDRPKKRPIYSKKKKPQKQQDAAAGDNSAPSSAPETPLVEESKLIEDLEKKEVEKKVEEEKEEPKDAWDISSAEEEEEEEEEDSEPKSEEAKAPEPVEISVKDSKEEEVEEEDEEEEEDEDDEGESSEEESSEEESSDESSSEEENEKLSPAEKLERRLEKTRDKIQKRKAENEANRTTDNLRAPVVCVLGHVDTGKTKILDKLRRTNVQDGEAGGITQQIGATNVPSATIVEQTKMCKEFTKKELKIPGLLIIDTPGHESFSNLRTRGSGLCDIAVLVVDIMHGLEPQTIESINLLKSRKTPFVIALNKIDRLYGWQTNPHSDVHNTLKKQKPNTKMEFEERAKAVIVQMAEQGLNTALYYENKNPREYVSLIPTSAHSGDGIGSLIALICELCQTMLAKRLAYSQELEAVAMEVKAIAGLGTTVDVILVNGKLREGQTIVMAGTEGPIVTQIRGLLMPQPLRELRVKNAYTRNKEVLAAQGVKVIAKDMEKALAGFPVYVAENQDEIEVYRQEIDDVITDVLDSIKVQEKGVYVQASTLGSLEALLEFLRTSKIPFSGINIGPVHKKDIMRSSAMLERESQYAVILAFDVKVERDAQEFADSVGVRIFTADIIYHLFDAFMGYREELKRQKQEEFRHLCVFPAKLKILPNCVFNSRDPIVVGVVVEAGFIKEGTPVCVPAKQFVEIGRITSIEFNHKAVDIARKGNEVCIKIDPIPGDAPKMVGRHFEETDQLVSKITRQSIDTVKNYFREEMSKSDWQLIMEMKKMFGIL